MSTETIQRLEGGQVSVALRGGHRLDDCQLISGPRGRTATLWLFDGGTDIFIPSADVLDLWEAN
ncbi:MAG: hypothetical protein ACRDZ3_16465 [Acidimicrobiia bacterium]